MKMLDRAAPATGRAILFYAAPAPANLLSRFRFASRALATERCGRRGFGRKARQTTPPLAQILLPQRTINPASMPEAVRFIWWMPCRTSTAPHCRSTTAGRPTRSTGRVTMLRKMVRALRRPPRGLRPCRENHSSWNLMATRPTVQPWKRTPPARSEIRRVLEAYRIPILGCRLRGRRRHRHAEEGRGVASTS
jgi:hypothetical protein